MVPKVKICENYEIVKPDSPVVQVATMTPKRPEDYKLANATTIDTPVYTTIKTRMKLHIIVMNVEYFIEHRYYPDKNTIAWTLDYNKNSDLDDSIGIWYVEPHPTKEDSSRVFYSCNVLLKNWVPKVVRSYLEKTSLKQVSIMS